MQAIFRRTTLSVLLSLALSLCGCMRTFNKAVVRNNPYRASIAQDLSGGWLANYRALPEGTDAEKAVKQERRNQIINEFVWFADDAYYQWEPNFYASGATISTIFDFASLGLTGATTVANSPKVLGAMATGVQGGNASIAKNFYDQQSRSVIVQKMRQLRDAALVRIADGENKDLTAYSLDQGIVDVQNYYYAGTVTAALQGLASSTATQHAQDKTDLNTARQGTSPAQTIK